MTTLALASLLPFIELDGTVVGQFMLARPLVVGSLFGLALQRPLEGLAAGAVIEAMSTEEPPVGGRVPLNATVAAGVTMLLSAPAAIGLPVGLLAGWVHAQGEQLVRQRRVSLCALAEEGCGGWPLIARSLGQQLLWTAAVVACAVYAAGPAASWAWPRLPELARAGLETGWKLAPWLAVAALLKAFRRTA